MGIRAFTAIAASALLASISPASALSIISFSGTQDTLAAGDNLTNDFGQFTSDTTPYLFLESSIISGPISQWVYLFHFDSPGNNGGDVADDFQIQLDRGSNLVTLLPSNTADLAAQDAVFGVAGVTYPSAEAGRGLEGNDAFSLGALVGNLQTIAYNLRGNGNNLDQIRFVVTNNSTGGGVPTPQIGPIPEPSTWAMMLVGFGMLGSVLRRRQRQSARGRVVFA